MESLYRGTHKITMVKDQSGAMVPTTMRVDVPPEELAESLAARIRPLLVQQELIYYTKVLDAIESAVSDEQFRTVSDEPVSWWREKWDHVANRSEGLQAFKIVTDAGTVTDRDLLYAWLYADLVHADERKAALTDISLGWRFAAAATVLSRIANAVESTMYLVLALRDEGLIDLPTATENEEVTVPRGVVELEVEGWYVAPVGTASPSDLGELGPDWEPFTLVPDEEQ